MRALLGAAAGVLLFATTLPVHAWHIPVGPPPEVFETEIEPETEMAKTGEVEGKLGPRRSRYTAADVHAALRTASARARCIVRYEVGGLGYNPYAVGSQGERGPAQLHPRGLLPRYLQWSGGDAPENPYKAVPFVDWGLANGYARHWSPVIRGLC